MNGVAPELFHRRKSQPDTEDLALTFLEEEIGRFDWQNNWKAVKAKGNVREKVQRWLKALNVEHNPDEIVAFLDDYTARQAGRWR
jgi:hypothetical protein